MNMKVFAHYQNNHQTPNKSISLSLRGEVAKRIPSSDDSTKIQSVLGNEVNFSNHNGINRAPSELITEEVLFESPYNAVELLNRVKYLSSRETTDLIAKGKQEDLSLVLFGNFQANSREPDQVFCLRNNLGKFELAFIVEDDNRTGGAPDLKPIFGLSEYQETNVSTPQIFTSSPEKVSDEEARLFQLASNAKYSLKTYLYPHKDDALITINALLTKNRDPKFWTKNRLEVLKVIDFRLYKALEILKDLMLKEARNGWIPAHRFLINPTVFWVAPKPNEPLKPKAQRELSNSLKRSGNIRENDYEMGAFSSPIIKEIPWQEQIITFLGNPFLDLSANDVSKIVTEGINHQKHFSQGSEHSNKLLELAQSEYFRAILLDTLKSIKIDSLTEQSNLPEDRRTAFAKILLKDKGIITIVKSNEGNGQKLLQASKTTLNFHSSQIDERNNHEQIIENYFNGPHSISVFEIITAAISCDKKPNKSADLHTLLIRLAEDSSVLEQIESQLRFDASLIGYFRSQKATEPEHRNPFAANVLRVREFASVA